MNKKKDKPKQPTRKRKCLRCNKEVELPFGYFMCPTCRVTAGNDSVTELGITIKKR
jgi:Zn finger protein HypA/HybF involved in hydrogenase expression